MTPADRAFIQANIALATAVILCALVLDSPLFRVVTAGAWLLLGVVYAVLGIKHS